ncbi:hypothetical protein Dimus_002168 [Dionaea muscipula]
MSDSAKPSDDDFQELLKPFHQRASEAEGRLSRLEAALSNKQDSGSEESSKLVRGLQLKLEEVSAELAAERAKVARLTIEGAKKDYRILHLLRSLNEASDSGVSIQKKIQYI